jgi:hypothetical protein
MYTTDEGAARENKIEGWLCMCEKQSTCDQCKKQEPSKNSAAQENNEKNGLNVA